MRELELFELDYVSGGAEAGCSKSTTTTTTTNKDGSTSTTTTTTYECHVKVG